MTALLQEGHTHAVVAERLGFSESAIERRVKKLGLESARTGPRAGSGHRQKWASGKVLDREGYAAVWVPLHPHAQHNAYVFEHRLLMEAVLDRYLDPKEIVHHKDGCRWHNWPDNLQLFPDNASHLSIGHSREANTIRRKLVYDAEQNNTWIAHCSALRDTLARCPEEITTRLEQYIERHRPTTAHKSLARRAFLRTGALDREGDQAA